MYIAIGVDKHVALHKNDRRTFTPVPNGRSGLLRPVTSLGPKSLPLSTH